MSDVKSEVKRDLNRRDFIAAAAVTGVVLTVLPDCLCAAPPTSGPMVPKGPVEVGTLADYDKDGINDKFAAKSKFFVIRNEGKLYASSAVCTHKGCTLKKTDNVLNCPCHKGQFDIYGAVTKKPPADSLLRYAISVGDDKKIMVDKSQEFSEKKWEDKKAFIEIPKG